MFLLGIFVGVFVSFIVFLIIFKSSEVGWLITDFSLDSDQPFFLELCRDVNKVIHKKFIILKAKSQK